MKSNLYLLQFNNYYNRQVKILPTINSYSEFMCEGILNLNPIPDVNFIPSDGITTTQVINWDGETPDYLLVGDNNTVVSRWFVIESVRLLTGQFKLTLYRDTVADYYNDIIKAPMFVEKGWVGIDDPAIHNMENITTNQIKSLEVALKDDTKTSWIVGYCDESDNSVSGETINFGGIPIPTYVVDDISDWEYAELLETENALAANSSINFSINYEYEKDGNDYTTTFDDTGMLSTALTNEDVVLELKEAYQPSAIKCSSSTIQTAINQFKIPVGEDYSLGNVLRLKDKIIKEESTGKYYRIHVSTPYDVDVTKDIKIGTNLYNALNSDISKLFTGDFAEAFTENTVKCNWTISIFSVNLLEITVTEGYTLHLAAKRPVLKDAPYCMFCIPFGDYSFTYGNTEYTVDKDNAFYLANGIATSLATKLYDIQLLPYCPISLLRDNGTHINLDDYTDILTTTVHTDSRTVIFYCTESSGTFNINYNYKTLLSPLEYKIRQQTTTMRLCSPNYNGVFEFNPFYNRGIDYFNVDYTYKPFQPYIHINPNFKNLYGQDFNDARGLICGGEFSLPIMSDAWNQYEIQNKNYQNMFNRQIENMETTQRISRKLEEWQVWAGAGSAALSGGVTGAMATGGNPYVTAGGAVASGIGSYAAGQADIKYNEMLRSEAIDYTKDNFGYQLDNIKALPNSLTRVSSYNANNKIFPFVEIYRCTDIERQAVRNKIKYNGMTIGRIGTLEEFLPYIPQSEFGFFKGQIIRLENIGDDFHVANVIAGELNKGVYLI